MSKNEVIDSLSRIDDDMIQVVETLRRKKKRSVWMKWGTLAACLCMVVAIVISTVFRQSTESPNDTIDPGSDSSGPACLVVNGIQYLISSHVSVSDELPGGFTYAGKADVGGFGDCPYYTNPNVPEWVYVYQEVGIDGTFDETGSLTRTDPYGAYVRYVDIRLRGKDIVCYNGDYYISMWSAQSYGSFPDVSYEYYNKIENTYGIRVEGDVPAGFISAGIAEFSGNDTLPRGELVSNVGAHEVYVNPDVSDVLLVPAYWHTHTKEEGKETKHKGYNIYIRYDCPLD